MLSERLPKQSALHAPTGCGPTAIAGTERNQGSKGTPMFEQDSQLLKGPKAPMPVCSS